MNVTKYQHLLEFITDKRKMRMAHIYQPVMLMTSLQNQGRSSVEQIAKTFLMTYGTCRRSVIPAMP